MVHMSKKFLVLSFLLVLTACGTDSEPTENEIPEKTASEIVDDQKEVSTDEETEDIIVETDTHEVENKFQGIYDELAGKSFIFSSGAGAWRTSFTFKDNGEFSGTYSDANGPDIAVSGFIGHFNINEEVDEFTYLLDLADLEVTSETGKEEQDGEMTITYVDEPHGFPSGSSTFELYLPYKPKSEVSDEYLSWVYGQANNQYEFLNSFGLYNVNHEFGMEELLN